mmetsp:Transcript_47793/g.61288  ORF Transcript_47793/g.61288 Transcript_47793/m.61288 type:complete len:154 (+) Transcript_47793:98-559(+)
MSSSPTNKQFKISANLTQIHSLKNNLTKKIDSQPKYQIVSDYDFPPRIVKSPNSKEKKIETNPTFEYSKSVLRASEAMKTYTPNKSDNNATSPTSSTTSSLKKPEKPTRCGEFSEYFSLPHQHITAFHQPKPGSSIALKNSQRLPGMPGWRTG